jgi:hypothetical protein
MSIRPVDVMHTDSEDNVKFVDMMVFNK